MEASQTTSRIKQTGKELPIIIYKIFIFTHVQNNESYKICDYKALCRPDLTMTRPTFKT